MVQNTQNRRVEVLDFIQSMLAQLRGMAEAERLDMLSYLIEMAYFEANDQIRDEQAHADGRGNDRAA